MNLYPETVAEFATLLAALSPIVIWSISGLLKSISVMQERASTRWDRVSTLAAIMYNKDHEFGSWKQVIAVAELGTQFVRKREALSVLSEAKDFWKNKDISPALKAAVDLSISRLQRNFWVRLINP